MGKKDSYNAVENTEEKLMEEKKDNNESVDNLVEVVDKKPDKEINLEDNSNENSNKIPKKPKNDKPFWKDKKKMGIFIGVFLLLFIVSVLLVGDSEGDKGTMSYNEFWKAVDAGQIDKVEYNQGGIFVNVYFEEGVGQEEVYDEETGEIRELEIVDGQRMEKVLNPGDDEFFKNLALKDVDIYVLEGKGAAILGALLGLLPTIILFILIFYMIKMQFGGNMNSKSGKLAVKSTTKFTDVAGMTEEKEELLFAIKSLQRQEEYLDKGVKPVRGILLEGPPGVGKTLLAKAVAGEAGVNFLSYSGSDFVEMFVGLGAKRVRNMCDEAEKLKPCVVFIDEIDALGRKRVAGGNGGTQEADQTLVALLERMDGLNTTSGILFIAATNRVDALDSALLRPGRFDKTIHVSHPKTKEDREAIVAVHSKDKTFGEGVTVEKIAKQCYGLTGAEIAAALNDAVLESFKAERNGIIDLEDIDKAIMKLYAKGLAKGRHSDKDMYRVSVHEVGHAMMNKHLGRNVVKVSIQPYSSGVGGVTQIDGESSGLDGLRTKTDIKNDIKVLYAGKVAEEVILGECSVGASNDLERATYAIRDYIGTYGMKDGQLLSLVGLGRENMLISANENMLKQMQELAEEIYAEVKEYFELPVVKARLEEISKGLAENEVIYDFDEVYNSVCIDLTKGEENA